jgi:site-specific recombinase XerD
VLNQFSLVIEFLDLYGVRISEVLKLQFDNIISEERIFIVSNKNSNDRMIFCPDWIAKLRELKGNETSGRVFNLTYSKVANYCKKHGIGASTKHGKNRRVTHYFRAKKIQTLKVEGLTNLEIKDYIGHKRLASTESYLQGSVIS